MFGIHWEDRFWFPFEEDHSILLYPAKIVGYSSDYSFLNGSDRPFGYLRGQQELTLGNGEPVMKEDLLFIESKSIRYKTISLDSRRQNSVYFRNINTYIQKEIK